jgi:hypothetical protein
VTRALLALAAALLAVLAPAPARPASPADQRVDLTHAAWQLDGQPTDTVAIEPAAPTVAAETERRPDVVRLPCPKRDARWTCEFSTEDAFTARLLLDWRGSPDGLLFELMLDGRRLSPARDGWRPSARDLRSDLGSVWLGAGRHLLEVLPREAAPGAALRFRALELQRL